MFLAKLALTYWSHSSHPNAVSLQLLVFVRGLSAQPLDLTPSSCVSFDPIVSFGTMSWNAIGIV